MPVTLVWIGLNGPRTVSPALGLGSQRSMWLGAPELKIRITDLALPFAFCVDSALSQSFQNRPRAAAAPACRKGRREQTASWSMARIMRRESSLAGPSHYHK